MRAIIMLGMLYLTGCATIVNGERQQVFFRGGPEKGVTKVQTPDGTFDIENGSGAYMMTRSKSDIPLKVTCPDGQTKGGVVETGFHWGWGGLGNILNGGWGWFIDPFMSNAYVIDDVSLMAYCSRTPQAAH